MSKKPLKVPEYFKDLPDDAKINSRDVALVFGYKSAKTITQAYQKKRIPEPDFKEHSKISGHALLYWKVKTIREWIENAKK